MKARLGRRNAGFFPVDRFSEDNLKRIKPNEIIEVEFKKPRNPQFHRKFFALLGIVLDNQSNHKNVDTLLHELKLRLGYYDMQISMSGKPMYIPRSISFAKMDNDHFAEFYSQTVDIILKHFIKGSTESEINRQVDELVGFF